MKLRPAHEVVTEMLEGAADNLSTAIRKGEKNSFAVGIFTGRILAAIFILRRMIIPEKHLSEVAEKLRGIHIPRSQAIDLIDMEEMASNVIADNAAHQAAKSGQEVTVTAEPVAQVTANTITGPAM